MQPLAKQPFVQPGARGELSLDDQVAQPVHGLFVQWPTTYRADCLHDLDFCMQNAKNPTQLPRGIEWHETQADTFYRFLARPMSRTASCGRLISPPWTIAGPTSRLWARTAWPG